MRGWAVEYGGDMDAEDEVGYKLDVMFLGGLKPILKVVVVDKLHLLII